MLPGQAPATALDDAEGRVVVRARGFDPVAPSVVFAREHLSAERATGTNDGDDDAEPFARRARAEEDSEEDSEDAPSVRGERARMDSRTACDSRTFYDSRTLDPLGVGSSVVAGELEMGPALGRGAYGAVRRATWRRRLSGAAAPPDGLEVAVKSLHAMSGASRRDLVALAREVAVLSRLDHPCVVKLLGACLHPPDVFLVEELARGGSLYDHIHGGGCFVAARGRSRSNDADADADADATPPPPPPPPPMRLPDVLRVARDVAAAAAYLSARRVVHRDLKSRNVLLLTEDDRPSAERARDRVGRTDRTDRRPRVARAKVCDFGIAKVLAHTRAPPRGGGEHARRRVRRHRARGERRGHARRRGGDARVDGAGAFSRRKRSVPSGGPGGPGSFGFFGLRFGK